MFLYLLLEHCCRLDVQVARSKLEAGRVIASVELSVDFEIAIHVVCFELITQSLKMMVTCTQVRQGM